MQKPYFPPQLLKMSEQSEGTLRMFLAPILLCSNTKDLLYRSAGHTLFSLECDTACHNLRCFQHGIVKPPVYTVSLREVINAPLSAIEVLLRDTPYRFSSVVHGNVVCNLAAPRYLQLALLALVRGGLKSKVPLSVSVDIPTGCYIFKGNIPQNALRLSQELVKTHGGRLLRSDTACALQFPPPKKKTACPRWQTPDADGLIYDSLSVVHLALFDL